MLLLSIIIPVYNAEMFLHECLNSIFFQYDEEVEVILVNDGSTDDSERICREYERKYDRIKLFNQQNEGVSVARNSGLSLASSKYVMFVDADDRLEDGCFAYFKRCLSSQFDIDIVQYGFFYHLKNGNVEIRKPKNECFYNNLNDYAMGKDYYTSIWGYVIKREILFSNSLRFMEGVKYAEDQEFILKVFCSANNIYTIDKSFYHYNYIESSAMNKSYSYDRAFDTLLVLDSLLNLYSKKKTNSSLLLEKEIKSLFENYFRTVAKVQCAHGVFSRANVDLKGLYSKHELCLSDILGVFSYIKIFPLVYIVFYYKWKPKLSVFVRNLLKY